MSEYWFPAGWYTSFLIDLVQEENFIRDKQDLRSRIQHVLVCDKFGPSRRMPSSFVSFTGDGEDGSVLWLAIVLLLCALISQRIAA